ncbi:islet amyloid polypeptide [Spea bombifrons]|uniref:islet amyloid polypeptide n=1 Tax=Spea bombifrons TaxID=233779 RepID=UPI00234BF02F|nr:islet amyloid polypeptide [Spea bombifrons]
MCCVNLMAALLVLSVTFGCQDAAPLHRLESDGASNGTSEKGWRIDVQARYTLFTPTHKMPRLETPRERESHQLEKRKCNTATCVTQRLADFLVRSHGNIGAIYSPTNVGSFTYGKRNVVGLLSRESFDYLQR